MQTSSVSQLRGSIADIMALHNFRKILRQAGYTYNYFNPATTNPEAYGTAIFTKIRPLKILKNCGHIQDEGRNITAIFQDFIFVLSYTPTLGTNAEGELTQIERRKTYDNGIEEYLLSLKTNHNKPIIYSGDLNTIIHDHHIHDKTLIGKSQPGATEEERQHLHKIMKQHNLVDSYDTFHTTGNRRKNCYTYFFSKHNGIKVDHFLIPQQWCKAQDENTPKSFTQTL